MVMTMTRKDFRKAAMLIKRMTADDGLPNVAPATRTYHYQEAYIELFKGDPLFNEEWFKKECEPSSASVSVP
jgi:hypothetical protein